jgi:hypothetical protein
MPFILSNVIECCKILLMRDAVIRLSFLVRGLLFGNDTHRPAMAAPPPEHNCVHGDALCGNDPVVYDGRQCGYLRCPNFHLCGAWTSPVYLNIHNGRCGICNSEFRKNLVFTEHAPPVACPICLDDKPLHIKHPAQCGHSACYDCFKEAWLPSHCVHLNPRDYGFTTDCGCKQCTSDDTFPCTSTLTAWATSHLKQAQQWRRDKKHYATHESGS